MISVPRHLARVMRLGALILALGGALALGGCARHGGGDSTGITAPSTTIFPTTTASSTGGTTTGQGSTPAQQIQSVQASLSGDMHTMESDATTVTQTFSEGSQP